MKLFVVLLGLLMIMPLAAQDEDILDWDFDTIFYRPELDIEELAEAELSALDLLRRPGFIFD